MLKRIIFSLLVLLVVYSSVLVGYKMFEPEDTEDAGTAFIERSLDYDTLKEYTLNSGVSAIHYYFFGSSTSNDSLYVLNTVFRSVDKDTSINLDSLMEFVDIAHLEQTMASNLLKTDWDITSYPAFVACQVQDGKIVILNELEWNPNSPMSETDVIQWLVLNGLYDGDEPDVLATPAS